MSVLYIKRPLIPSLFFLIFGILVGYYQFDRSLSTVLAMVAAITVYLYSRRKSTILFFAFYIAGLAVVLFRTGVDPEMAALVGEKTVIRGVVVDESSTYGGFRLVVKTENKTRIMLRTMNEGPVGTGGMVVFPAAIEELSRGRDPGGFDEYLYFRARGVQFKAFIREVTPEPAPPSLLSLRSRLSSVYDRLLPSREAGIVKAMVIGNRTGLGDDIKELYRISGVFHLLSISGLHISTLALFINLMLIRIIGRRPSGIVTIGFLAAYCVFTGMSPSAIRAALMGTVIISGDILWREKDSLSGAAFAAILILLWQPLYIFDAGFQYSFSAVFGIIMLAVPMSRLIAAKTRKIPKFLIDTFAVSFAATAATTPVAAWHFYHVMPYGLLANLLITPSASFVIVSGFLVGVLGVIAQPLAVLPASMMYFVFRFYEWVCEFFALLPGAVVLTGRWSAIFVIGWYIPVIAAGVYWSDRARRRPRLHITKTRFMGILTLWLAVYIAAAFVYALPKTPEVYRLADSDCVVVRQGGEAFVFDGGADIQALKGFLDYRGVRRVAYFGLHDNLNRADATVDRLENVYAVFAIPALGELRYYETSGIHYSEISIGSVLKRGELEFHITEGLGVKLRIDGQDIMIRRESL